MARLACQVVAMSPKMRVRNMTTVEETSTLLRLVNLESWYHVEGERAVIGWSVR